ncbi:MAG: ArnT family glycosyltransferase [Chloroflexota bacterium]
MKKLSRISRFWPEALLFGLCVVLYGYNAARFDLPLGYAGLYALMAEQVGAAHFAMPFQVPYYGPGGLPFAYPPLAAYLAAFLTQALNLPILAYARFAPVFFGLLALATLYVLALRLLQSRPKAWVGVLLAACFAPLYAAHLYAAGIMRGPAFVLMLVGLIFAWDALRAEAFSWRKSLLAGAFLGLAGLSHLSYAVFFGVSALAFALADFSFTAGWRKLAALCVMAAVGVLVAAPWWLVVLSRHGPAVFTSASQTHGTLGLVARANAGLVSFANLLSQHFFNFGKDWSPDILPGLVVLGLGLALARRKWLLPLWFMACFLFIGERDRFLGLVAVLLVADLLVDLTQAWPSRPSPDRRAAWLAWLPVLLVLAFCYRSALKLVAAERPVLSQPVVAAGAWLQGNTPQDAVFLFAGGSHDLAEWLPYLAQRTPAVGLWGAEWTGAYARQSALSVQLSDCAERQAFDGCVNRLIQDEELHPGYLIIPTGLEQLRVEIEAASDWQLAFENDALAVFANIP